MTDVLPTPTGQPTDRDLDQIQADLRRAREETVGDTPLIQESVDPMLDLPRGLHHNGSWQRRVLVRELNGMDEETLSRVRDITEIYDTVLGLGVVRIGELDLGSLPLVERLGHLGQLLLGERDQLYLAVIRATYGDRKTLRYTCQNEGCGEAQDLILTLSKDFEPRHVDDVERTEFEYRSPKGHVIMYRPAIGSDQVEALKKRNATTAESNSIILSRCIKTVDGAILVDPLLEARKLSMIDRNALLNLLLERQPGFDMTVTINCVACREEQVIPLGWGDLFRP